MTTIVVTRDKILSDGLVTWGNKVDATNFKKIRKIKGYLVGGAGRATSVLNFFAWFEKNLRSLEVTEVFNDIILETLPEAEDEDFTAIVVHPTGEIYFHEGNNPSRSYQIHHDFYSIGSGSDFAMGALKAGATPEEALDIAKSLDIYSGGETFIESLDAIPIALTEEQLEDLSKEELIQLVKTGVIEYEPK